MCLSIIFCASFPHSSTHAHLCIVYSFPGLTEILDAVMHHVIADRELAVSLDK